ncbi:hypothetical protein Drorol1_Dr00010135 [Drosera rotundifolia]
MDTLAIDPISISSPTVEDEVLGNLSHKINARALSSFSVSFSPCTSSSFSRFFSAADQIAADQIAAAAATSLVAQLSLPSLFIPSTTLTGNPNRSHPSPSPSTTATTTTSGLNQPPFLSRTHSLTHSFVHYVIPFHAHHFIEPTQINVNQTTKTTTSRAMMICGRNRVLSASSSLVKVGEWLRCLGSHVVQESGDQPPRPHRSDSSGYKQYADVDWGSLGFSLKPTDYMYVMNCSKDETFLQGELSHFGNIPLSPAAGVLNYGQGLFEGLKAIKRQDGCLVLFRPDLNAARMKVGADRMCMPSPSVEQFIDAIKHTTLANKRWVPPPGLGFLYMRPLLLGTGAMLGLAAAPAYTFLVYASPVQNYFKDGQSLNLIVEDEYDRASAGGAGGVKSITNYGPALKPLTKAKNRGFSDVLFLDSVHGKYIEETSCSNIFILKDNIMSTPLTNGTILPGVTRKCILNIAFDHGYEVQERSIRVEELFEAEEVFCTANAIGIAPVGSITYQGNRIKYRTDAHSVSKELLSTLRGIQNGSVEDKKGWIVEVA